MPIHGGAAARAGRQSLAGKVVCRTYLPRTMISTFSPYGTPETSVDASPRFTRSHDTAGPGSRRRLNSEEEDGAAA